ncbi:MAG: hypothetical protein NZ518_08205, partial [Dehalococcoidia bacterium]|nr:hypothetical protein [Dehalococcoidia bacterium]
IVSAGEPPPDWTEEAWARDRGAQDATGDWLLFTTPNTVAEPTLVMAALSFARKHRLDALTLFGRPIAKGFGERVINPVVYHLLSLANPVPQVNNPTFVGVAIVLAEFLLIRRQVYRDTGGYRAVAARSSPHRVLARLIKTSGYRLWIGDGSAFFQTRRYRTLQQALDGWAATLRVIADHGAGAVWAVVALVVVFHVLPFVLFLGGVIGSLFETRSAWWTTVALIGLVQVAFVIGSRRRIDALCAAPAWYAVLHPVGGLLLAWILISRMQPPRRDGTMRAWSHQA